MATTAAVLGRNYTSRLGMIRAAGEAGLTALVIKTEGKTGYTKDKTDESSRYVRGYWCAPEPKEDELIQVLLEHCKSLSGQKTVILPTDDYTASVIDRRQRELEADFLFPHIRHEPGAVVRCMDKAVQKRLAREAGLPVAEGWRAVFDGEGFTLPEGVLFPCFVKPEVSFQGSKFHMRKCETAQELNSHLAAVAADLKKRNKHTDLLVEQFIPIDREIDIPGFTDGEQVVTPIFIEKGVIHLGVTGTGTLRPAAEFGGAAEKLAAMIRSLGFVGLIDIEMFESGGTLYFNELNMRFGASGYAATGAGINLPRLLIAALTGEKVQPDFSGVSFAGKSFASEKVCFQEYRDRKIGYGEFRRLLREADFTFLQNAADPEPYKVFRGRVNAHRYKRILTGLLGRK